MSRIGKKPIEIPEGVSVEVAGQKVTAKGPGGELSVELRPDVKAEVKEGQVVLATKNDTTFARSLWGLSRTLVANIIIGVAEGFKKELEVIGVGYTANVQGDNLVLKVGYSHPVEITPPRGIKFEAKKNVITVAGADKQLVGQVAAEIRAVRKPEPYKGKGIKYIDEKIRRKAGKTGKTAGAAGS